MFSEWPCPHCSQAHPVGRRSRQPSRPRPLTAFASAASAWIATAFPPLRSMAFTTAEAALASFAYVMATLAPSAASRFAIAAPMPRDPPVMSATLLANFDIQPPFHYLIGFNACDPSQACPIYEPFSSIRWRRCSRDAEILNYVVLYRTIHLWGVQRTLVENQVLEKAMSVFWKHGFSDTSLQELERATGVNKSGLYTEFRDKEDLFVACLRYYLESQQKRGLLTKKPLGWNNVETFLKNGPLNKGEQQGCFSVNSMREFAVLPDEAYKVVTKNRARLLRHLAMVTSKPRNPGWLRLQSRRWHCPSSLEYASSATSNPARPHRPARSKTL